MKRIGNLRIYATILFTIGLGFLIFSLKRCQYNEITQAKKLMSRLPSMK